MSTDFESQKEIMVRDHLQHRGISDPKVLSAMMTIPREHFVPTQYASLAYTDQALKTEHGQTISQPYIVALMTEKLDLAPHHRVLEIGTGTGYQAAILSRIVNEVYTVERIGDLARSAEPRLKVMGFENIHCLHADGTLGWNEFAPYDRIMVTAATPSLPAELLNQMADNAKLIVPIGPKKSQWLRLIERSGQRTIETSLIPCRFVPLLPNQQ